jgi:hypothetical protein
MVYNPSMVENFKLTTYPTVESINIAFYSFEEPATIEDLMASEHGGYDEHGNEITFTFEEVLSALRDMGYWGFSNVETGDVHVWIENATDEQLLFLLGHEIGLIIEHRIEEGKEAGNEDVAEEEHADRYGLAATLAYQWMKEIRETGNTL